MATALPTQPPAPAEPVQQAPDFNTYAAEYLKPLGTTLSDLGSFESQLTAVGEKPKKGADVLKDIVNSYADNVLPQYYTDPAALRAAQGKARADLMPQVTAAEVNGSKDTAPEGPLKSLIDLNATELNPRDRANNTIALDKAARANGKKIVATLGLNSVDPEARVTVLQAEIAKRRELAQAAMDSFNAGEVSAEEAQKHIDLLTSDVVSLEGAVRDAQDKGWVSNFVAQGLGGGAKALTGTGEFAVRMINGVASNASGNDFSTGFADDSGVAGAMRDAREWVSAAQHDWDASDESQIKLDAMMKAFDDAGFPDGLSVLQSNPEIALRVLATTGVDSVAQLMVGGWVGKGVGLAATAATAARGASSAAEVANIAAGLQVAKMTGAVAATATTAAVTDAGDVRAFVQETYDAMGTDKFLSLPEVQADAEVWKNLDDAGVELYVAAKKKELSDAAFTKTAMTVAPLLAVSQTLGMRYGLEGVLFGGRSGSVIAGNVLPRTLATTAVGGMQEGTEEVVENGVQHFVSVNALHGSVGDATPFDNFSGAFTQGFIAGGIMDGMASVAYGERKPTPAPNNPTPQPTPTDDSTETVSAPTPEAPLQPDSSVYATSPAGLNRWSDTDLQQPHVAAAINAAYTHFGSEESAYSIPSILAANKTAAQRLSEGDAFVLRSVWDAMPADAKTRAIMLQRAAGDALLPAGSPQQVRARHELMLLTARFKAQVDSLTARQKAIDALVKARQLVPVTTGTTVGLDRGAPWLQGRTALPAPTEPDLSAYDGTPLLTNTTEGGYGFPINLNPNIPPSDPLAGSPVTAVPNQPTGGAPAGAAAIMEPPVDLPDVSSRALAISAGIPINEVSTVIRSVGNNVGGVAVTIDQDGAFGVVLSGKHKGTVRSHTMTVQEALDIARSAKAHQTPLQLATTALTTMQNRANQVIRHTKMRNGRALLPAMRYAVYSSVLDSLPDNAATHYPSGRKMPAERQRRQQTMLLAMQRTLAEDAAAIMDGVRGTVVQEYVRGNRTGLTARHKNDVEAINELRRAWFENNNRLEELGTVAIADALVGRVPPLPAPVQENLDDGTKMPPTSEEVTAELVASAELAESTEVNSEGDLMPVESAGVVLQAPTSTEVLQEYAASVTTDEPALEAVSEELGVPVERSSSDERYTAETPVDITPEPPIRVRKKKPSKPYGNAFAPQDVEWFNVDEPEAPPLEEKTYLNDSAKLDAALRVSEILERKRAKKAAASTPRSQFAVANTDLEDVLTRPLASETSAQTVKEDTLNGVPTVPLSEQNVPEVTTEELESLVEEAAAQGKKVRKAKKATAKTTKTVTPTTSTNDVVMDKATLKERLEAYLKSRFRNRDVYAANSREGRQSLNLAKMYNAQDSLESLVKRVKSASQFVPLAASLDRMIETITSTGHVVFFRTMNQRMVHGDSLGETSSDVMADGKVHYTVNVKLYASETDGTVYTPEELIRIMLHENLHAVTSFALHLRSRALDTDSNLPEVFAYNAMMNNPDLQKLLDAADSIKEIHRKVSDAISLAAYDTMRHMNSTRIKNAYYGIASPEEMVAELASPEWVSVLDGILLKGSTSQGTSISAIEGALSKALTPKSADSAASVLVNTIDGLYHDISGDLSSHLSAVYDWSKALAEAELAVNRANNFVFDLEAPATEEHNAVGGKLDLSNGWLKGIMPHLTKEQQDLARVVSQSIKSQGMDEEVLFVTEHVYNTTPELQFKGQGLYDAILDRVLIAPHRLRSAEHAARAILHEKIHKAMRNILTLDATTEASMRVGKPLTESQTIAHNFMADVEATRKHVVDTLNAKGVDTRGVYGLKDGAEMLAELANPAFTRILSTIPAPNTTVSVWSKLLRIVRKWLGLTTNDTMHDVSLNLLERAITLTEMPIMDKGYAQVLPHISTGKSLQKAKFRKAKSVPVSLLYAKAQQDGVGSKAFQYLVNHSLFAPAATAEDVAAVVDKVSPC